jgi:DNA (cytosine-5)-methyltransferase 1
MWECIIGRPAPAPTIPGRRVSRVLNPVFVEWMMGLNEGYVTHCPDLTRTQMLRLLGNGVVPQQAVYALHHLITVLVETEISSEHDGEAAEVRQ